MQLLIMLSVSLWQWESHGEGIKGQKIIQQTFELKVTGEKLRHLVSLVMHDIYDEDT